MEDGKELLFDHAAPCFTLSNAADVMGLIGEWESRGLVAEWKGKFGSFDCLTNKFVDAEQVQIYILTRREEQGPDSSANITCSCLIFFRCTCLLG